MIERIELRKIYFRSGINFGLVFGLFLGMITFLVIASFEFFGDSLFPSSQIQGYTIAALAGLGCFVAFFLLSIFITLLYNLSVKIGGRIDFGLAESGKNARVDPEKLKERMKKSEN